MGIEGPRPRDPGRDAVHQLQGDGTPVNDIERRTDKLAALRERVERLPGYEGELGTDIKTTSPETLLVRGRGLRHAASTR